MTVSRDNGGDLGPRAEVERLLESDPSRLGDIYRWKLEGLSRNDIKERVGAKDNAFVYSYEQVISAALNGTTTANGPTARRSVIGALNSLIKKARAFPLPPEAIQLLVEHRAAVETAGASVDDVAAAQAEQEERDDAVQTLSRMRGVAGIYAFSYGWYLEHPADESRDTTFIKVGKALNVEQRIREHMGGARTHMPEPLALVRVYTGARLGADLDIVEKQFHQLLATAGHENPRWAVGRRVGKEWTRSPRSWGRRSSSLDNPSSPMNRDVDTVPRSSTACDSPLVLPVERGFGPQLAGVQNALNQEVRSC